MPMSTITVAGVNPGLKILGNMQQFNYNQPLSTFQIMNSFIPSSLVSSQFNQEIQNNLYSGFRWSHITTNTDTFGSLTLQSFVNAQSTGSDIVKFGSTGINIFTALNLNSSPGASGQVLTSQGAGAIPIWTTNGSGTVTSVATGTGLSGGPITISGTINIANTGVVPATYNGSFTVNAQGQITAANNTLRGVLASLYISGNSRATPTVANTPTKILGTSSESHLNGFIAPPSTDNELKYTGLDTITPLISINLAAIPSIASTISIMIYKNNVTAITGVIYGYQPTGGQPISLSLSLPVDFSTGDSIEVFIESDNGSTVTVKDMNLSIII